MAMYSPTPLDLALANDPVAEADSRAVAAAATPPNWSRLDIAAQQYAAAFEEGRRKLALEIGGRDNPAAARQASAA